jgi:hypothetical protein
MNSILHELSSVDLIPEIETILANAGRTRSDQIDLELQRLNQERTRAEIIEINSLIRWVEYGILWIGVPLMEDLVSLRYRLQSIRQKSVPSNPPSPNDNNAATTPVTTSMSLLPFAQKLQDKYTIFAINDRGVIDWRTPEIQERIPKKEHGVDLSIETDLSPQSQVVRESEVNVVRHFLTNVCPPELYRRFGFEQFFEARLGAGMKERICNDADNAHVLNALDCLHIILNDELKANTKALKVGIYSVLYHLKKADLALADRHLKEQVGPLLVSLLTEDAHIDTMFIPRKDASEKERDDLGSSYEENRREWIYALSPVTDMSKWFKDSAAVKLVTSELGKAIIAGAKDSNTNVVELLLSPIAKRMAHLLFRGNGYRDRTQVYSAAAILRGYLTRVSQTSCKYCICSDPGLSLSKDSLVEGYLAKLTVDIAF